MISDKRNQIWESLADSEYRHEFSNEQINTGLAFQIRALREGRGLTQEELAELSGKAQETISQLENPNYGRFTLTTLKKLAQAFDVALLVRFAPFSELVDWTVGLTPERIAPPSYQAEGSVVTVPTASKSEAQHYSPAKGWHMPVWIPRYFPSTTASTALHAQKMCWVCGAVATTAP